jgi:threonine-phosphate decarboxylase
MSNYKHGGDIYSLAVKLKCTPEEIIDFSSNINFVKPKVNIEIQNLNFVPYPDKNYTVLKQSAGIKYNISPEQILLFNGGSAAIFNFFRHYSEKYKNAVMHAPLYSEYKRAAQLFNYKIKLINRFEKSDNNLNYENSTVVYVHPSTPDGLLHPNIEENIHRDLKNNCTVLVDESFIEFSNAKSLTPLTQVYDKLFILKSMTKFYGTAGIRLGLLISNNNAVLEFQKKEPLWGISLFDAEYMNKALKNSSFKELSDKINDKNKKTLYLILKNSNLFEKIYHSDANFFMCKLKNISACKLTEQMENHKILIRDCSNFDFLDKQFVRFAVKDHESLKKLEEAFNE